MMEIRLPEDCRGKEPRELEGEIDLVESGGEETANEDCAEGEPASSLPRGVAVGVCAVEENAAEVDVVMVEYMDEGLLRLREMALSRRSFFFLGIGVGGASEDGVEGVETMGAAEVVGERWRRVIWEPSDSSGMQ